MTENSKTTDFILVSKCSNLSDLDGFAVWMKDVMDFSDPTIKSRVANVKKIEEYYGDLKTLWKAGKLDDLIEELRYSRDDEYSGAQPRHKIPITGDIYNGSATYRSAARLYKAYLEFRYPSSPSGSDVKMALRKAIRELKAGMPEFDKYSQKEVREHIALPLQKLLEKYLGPLGYTIEVEKMAYEVYSQVTSKETTKDRYDITCQAPDRPLIIIEIDTHRADQITKKMISRVAQNNGSDLIYVALIYPNDHKSKESEKKECAKYIDFLKTLFSMFLPPRKDFIGEWLC